MNGLVEGGELDLEGVHYKGNRRGLDARDLACCEFLLSEEAVYLLVLVQRVIDYFPHHIPERCDSGHCPALVYHFEHNSQHVRLRVLIHDESRPRGQLVFVVVCADYRVARLL